MNPFHLIRPKLVGLFSKGREDPGGFSFRDDCMERNWPDVTMIGKNGEFPP